MLLWWSWHTFSHTRHTFKKGCYVVTFTKYKYYRLGVCEYDQAGEMAAADAREIFLEILIEIKPEVIKSLKNDVLPFYKGKKVTIKNMDPDLRDKIKIWANKYNIYYDWVIEAVIETLYTWSHVLPEDFKEVTQSWQHFGLSPAYWLGTNSEDRKIKFINAGWDPASETRKSAKKRILESFERYLDYHFNEIENKVKKSGKVKTPELRKREYHFKWFIYSHVDKKTYKEIADLNERETHVGISESDVKKAVDKVGKFLILKN